MKISPKQMEEIQFLVKHFSRHFENGMPSEQEMQDYILHTVKGKKNLDGKFETENRLMLAKVSLDRTLRAMREDIDRGHGYCVFPDVVEDWGDSGYGKNLVRQLQSRALENAMKVINK